MPVLVVSPESSEKQESCFNFMNPHSYGMPNRGDQHPSLDGNFHHPQLGLEPDSVSNCHDRLHERIHHHQQQHTPSRMSPNSDFLKPSSCKRSDDFIPHLTAGHGQLHHHEENTNVTNHQFHSSKYHQPHYHNSHTQSQPPQPMEKHHDCYQYPQSHHTAPVPYYASAKPSYYMTKRQSSTHEDSRGTFEGYGHGHGNQHSLDYPIEYESERMVPEGTETRDTAWHYHHHQQKQHYYPGPPPPVPSSTMHSHHQHQNQRHPCAYPSPVCRPIYHYPSPHSYHHHPYDYSRSPSYNPINTRQSYVAPLPPPHGYSFYNAIDYNRKRKYEETAAPTENYFIHADRPTSPMSDITASPCPSFEDDYDDDDREHRGDVYLNQKIEKKMTLIQSPPHHVVLEGSPTDKKKKLTIKTSSLSFDNSYSLKVPKIEPLRGNPQPTFNWKIDDVIVRTVSPMKAKADERLNDDHNHIENDIAPQRTKIWRSLSDNSHNMVIANNVSQTSSEFGYQIGE